LALNNGSRHGDNPKSTFKKNTRGSLKNIMTRDSN